MKPQHLLLLTLLITTFTACGEDVVDEGFCQGPEILPHLSPVFLGELYPPEGDPNLATNERTPYEWVLLLQSTCDRAVKIDKVCLIGDPAKNGDDLAQFQLEGPRPDTASKNTDAALRLTYTRQQPAADNDGDGLPDPDSVAVVIQSNARNFPTLIVPICARVLANGTERGGVTCTTPVVVQPGEQDLSLCP